MRTAIVTAATASLQGAVALGQEQLWVRQWGTAKPDAVEPLAPDGASGAYAVWVVSFSFSTVYNLSRYDGDGTERWQVRLRAPTEISDVADDGAGGPLLAGQDDGDSWFARYDSAGAELWSRTVGSGLYNDFASRSNPMAPAASSSAASRSRISSFRSPGTPTRGSPTTHSRADPTGGLLMAGDTWTSFAGPHLGASDAWAARCGMDGDFIWQTQFGTTAHDAAVAVAGDSAGLYIGGGTTGSLGGPSAGDNDAFLARYGDRCPADGDGSGSLDFFDFLCFQNLFAAGDPRADCDGERGA